MLSAKGTLPRSLFRPELIKKFTGDFEPLLHNRKCLQGQANQKVYCMPKVEAAVYGEKLKDNIHGKLPRYPLEPTCEQWEISTRQIKLWQHIKINIDLPKANKLLNKYLHFIATLRNGLVNLGDRLNQQLDIRSHIYNKLKEIANFGSMIFLHEN